MAQKIEQTVTLAKRILSTFATGQPLFALDLLDFVRLSNSFPAALCSSIVSM